MDMIIYIQNALSSFTLSYIIYLRVNLIGQNYTPFFLIPHLSETLEGANVII